MGKCNTSASHPRAGSPAHKSPTFLWILTFSRTKSLYNFLSPYGIAKVLAGNADSSSRHANHHRDLKSFASPVIRVYVPLKNHSLLLHECYYVVYSRHSRPWVVAIIQKHCFHSWTHFIQSITDLSHYNHKQIVNSDSWCKVNLIYQKPKYLNFILLANLIFWSDHVWMQNTL